MSFHEWDPVGTLANTDQDECLIVEELCRVIAGARRFQTVIEAWKAMQNARRIAGEMRTEMQEHFGQREDECSLPSEKIIAARDRR